MNSHRSNALAAALDGKIYVFAGRRSPYGEVFDPDRGLWALLPEPPDFLGALLSDPSNARLLAHSRDDLYAYYPASNSWKSLNVNLSHYWTGTPCVIVDDVIYFCFTPDPDDHTHCLAAYDLVSNQPLDIK
ncbi:Kelch_1 domain-containing protein [Cephalotus follicularis]|uniref:Kelch_1 domain-containing protein n=1 Tax=Cephalotus follicularis TaxID=3775 RepID=A0A1Q3AVC2_CEPFO|nr:Kelch_1 domain-containing protein [Cephalotus follicularis]